MLLLSLNNPIDANMKLILIPRTKYEYNESFLPTECTILLRCYLICTFYPLPMALVIYHVA